MSSKRKTLTIEAEIKAIDTLFRLQREYRSHRSVRTAIDAFRIARKLGCEIPPWVLCCLDEVNDDILASNGDTSLIAAAVSRRGPKLKSEADQIAHAMGFMPGDFEGAAHDEAMFNRRDELVKQVNRKKKQLRLIK